MGQHGYRLPTGGLIDRSRTLRFTFNGRAMTGHPGDTLASALLANGVSIVGRSFKYHRPRGLYGVGLEDPSAILSVRDGHGFDPGISAGHVQLVDGLDARSFTGWPSVEFDLSALAQIGSSVLSAGFYYKTFKWPTWMFFEPLLVRATRLGRADKAPDKRSVQHRHLVADVLVIGSGPAGLAAARSLRGTGLKVVVADDQPRLGGSLLWEEMELDGVPGITWCRDVLIELHAHDDFTLLPSTMVTAAYENNVFTLVETLHDRSGRFAERHWTIKATHVLLATGMIDRPLLFEGNDRPGVMLSSSVRRLIGEFGVAPAKRLAVYTNNDSGYLTAINARRAGVGLAGIIDTRPLRAALHAAAARQLGIPCFAESQIEKTSGYRRLNGVVVRDSKDRTQRLACDGLASSGGWTPFIHLAAHCGAKPSYDPDRSMFLCPELPTGWFAIGGTNGALELDQTIVEAVQAAKAIAAARNVCANARPPLRVKAARFGGVTPCWIPRHGSTKQMWIDLETDVKVSDVKLAITENYSSVELLKRYTMLGMGTDQGRTANVNGLAVLATLTGRDITSTGITTFRPPFAGVRMATLANARRRDLYQPRRYLPANAVHHDLDGVMKDFGWERPDWYRSNGADREAAVAVEMAAVRQHVGVFDGSSLGKIEVTGRDAAKFLARFYVSNMATLTPGRIRYSVMLHEDGVIYDDGVVSCITKNHFLASPTSGHAEGVAAWFEQWRQTEWSTMEVAISPVTSNWAVMTIAGPHARELLRKLEPDFDISPESFPHMEFREGEVAGVRARVARISFTGELQYEIAVPARYARALLQTLLTADGKLSPRPVGMEAWLRLRLEKGYLHIGADTNGRTTPLDVGMAAIVAKRKDDFIGKRSLSLPFAMSREREQLVGLKALDGTMQIGGRIMAPGHSRVPCPTEGYVTSACVSPAVGGSIGLALIERGYQRDGEEVSVYSNGVIVRARICSPMFYDPQNERLHG
jgi:sarcosine oxidase subunit alpha